MMQIWAISKHQHSPELATSSGFTLLEVLFVLFILGLMVGLIGPRASKAVESAERAVAWRAFERSLVTVPRQTALSGKSVQLASNADLSAQAGAKPLLELPTGAEFTARPPWQIGANGACEASTLSLRWGDETRTYSASAPSCKLQGLTQ
jgi:prepilin-type N-terminal cleavage/methylation domain-containing protein